MCLGENVILPRPKLKVAPLPLKPEKPKAKRKANRKPAAAPRFVPVSRFRALEMKVRSMERIIKKLRSL